MPRRVSVQNAYGAEARVQRRPKHTFNLRTRPWQIQPFLLAPVLAGETLKAGTFQSRVVSDPIASKLIGWTCEYFFFYVKLSDLDARDTVTDLMLNPASVPGSGLSGLEEAADVKWYNYANSVPWAKLCLKRIVEEWFRNDGEEWDDYVLDGVPLASIGQEGLLNSFVPTDQLNDVDVLVSDGDDVVTASKIDEALRQWQMLQMKGLVSMTYDDYLRTFGVRAARPELHRPELLREYHEWVYPSNSVEPTTGAVSSVVSWSVSDRIDKDRYFTEPGFVIGVTVQRPKVYLKGLTGAGAGILDNLLAWLPAQMHGDAMSSLLEYAEGTSGPVANFDDASNAGYTIDSRDLFVYGDQYINFDTSAATDANLVTLPNANGTHRYADSTDANGLFVGATDATRLIRQDGVVTLQILGHQRDRTPGAPIPIAV